MLKLTLPLSPSANVYWRYVDGHPVKSEAARKYIKSVSEIAEQQHVYLTQGSIAVALEVHFDEGLSDLDNRIKVCLDSLNKIAYPDDRNIVAISAYKLRVQKPRKPVLVVYVMPIFQYVDFVRMHSEEMVHEIGGG